MRKRSYFLIAGIALFAAVVMLCGVDTAQAAQLLSLGSGGDYAVLAAAGAAAVALEVEVPALTGVADKDLKVLSETLKKLTDGLKASAEATAREIANTGKLSAETKANVDKMLTTQTEVQGRLTQVEQKLTAPTPRGGANDNRSIGTRFAEDENVVAFMKNKPRGSVRVDFKDLDVRNAITTATVGGPLIVPERVPGIIGVPERRLTVRDLITPGRTNSNSLEYVKEVGFTNAAAVVSEGTQKPESDIEFSLETTNVRTIAHWVIASRQILDDVPQLTSYIDGRLRYGLAYVEEAQLLRGSGTGQNLLGIIPQAVAFVAAFVVADQTPIDVLRLAILQSELAEYPATGMVLHPIDWARIELTKDSLGRYIIGNPMQLQGPTLWGKPIVSTQAMLVDEFLVGAFKLGAQVFDREDANVQISTEDRDNFVKNMVTIRCEERLALAVYRPECFVTGDFGAVT